jgi:hypothetical protein
MENFNITAIPLAVNYLIGNKKDFLELGAGVTYAFISTTSTNSTTSLSTEDLRFDIFNERFSSVLERLI